MDPIETLSNEHGLIRHFLDNLALATSHLEDHVFYPMARTTLRADEVEQLRAEFARQREKVGAETFERCHKIVIDMGSIITHLH